MAPISMKSSVYSRDVHRGWISAAAATQMFLKNWCRDAMENNLTAATPLPRRY
jgi:hypothetical protein